MKKHIIDLMTDKKVRTPFVSLVVTAIVLTILGIIAPLESALIAGAINACAVGAWVAILSIIVMTFPSDYL